MKPLKRVVLKEELVELTKDYKKAILLNQFIYWSERVSDFDKFITEEKERCARNDIDNNQEFLNGWMYKSAEDLSEETMLGLSKSNMGAHIKSLIDNGWLSERNNPIFKWDRTKQYRVNIIKIQQDLFKLGYALEGYPLITDFTTYEDEIPGSKTEHAENTEKNNIYNKNEETKHRSSIIEHASSETEHGDSKIEHGNSDLEPRSTRNETAIPEITTEITTYINNQSINRLSDRIDREKNNTTSDSYNNYLKLIKKNIEYEVVAKRLKSNELDDVDEIIALILSVVTSNKKTIRINSEEIPIELVKSQFIRLKYEHIEYVLECFKENTTEIKNIRAYLLTALYNAPMTIKKYYTSKVNNVMKE